MRLLLPTIAVLALAASALAQPPGDEHHPPGQATAASPVQMGMMAMMQGMMKCPMLSRPEGTLAFLKTELNIKPSQAGAWDAFATAFREIAASRGSMMGEGMMGGGMMAEGGRGAAMAKPLPERLAMHTQMMERHLGTAKKLQLAVQPLYTQLDAKQRKTADEIMPMTLMMLGR